MFTRGYRLTPLPATKSEVAAIAELYRGKADTYIGEAATEERAKGVSKDTTYLHFASHGLLDERFPLNSGLALTIPDEMKEGQDNGILQAWEIFERVRIDADLVVLSACETGLGKEMGGEGLVGLTRAFQYAGARSVLASLWSVADETTAALMKRFYGYLKAGESKDAALRHAQLDLVRGPWSFKRRTHGRQREWMPRIRSTGRHFNSTATGDSGLAHRQLSRTTSREQQRRHGKDSRDAHGLDVRAWEIGAGASHTTELSSANAITLRSSSSRTSGP